MPKKRSYRGWQLEKLANPERAASYLQNALEDSPEQFLIALGKVAQARQMSRVAAEAGIQRESLYRSLSSSGNPTLNTLMSVLKAVGLRLTITTQLTEEPKESRDYCVAFGETEGVTGSATLISEIVPPRIWKGQAIWGTTRTSELEGLIGIHSEPVGPLGVKIPLINQLLPSTIQLTRSSGDKNGAN
jgi:probable addiction module antidote protein